MPRQAVYRNILFFLLGLFALNLCIGFYSSVKDADNIKSTSINYIVQDKEVVDNSSRYGAIDYISEAKEMIDIFKKYDFTIDSFIKDQSANLIIFSSLPKDFMDINSVSERKKLFINTLLPIAFIENLKILDDRKNFRLVEPI